MSRNKYQMMRESEVTDNMGNAYPDLATFPLDQLITSSKPVNVKLTYQDTQRFFDFIYKFYNDFSFYDDMILWLNDITYISDSDENFEKVVKIYSKTDLDDLYLAGVRGEIVDNDNRVVL